MHRAAATRLDPEDIARLGMDTAENPMVVTALVRLDGPIAWEELLALVDARILSRPRMRARIVRAGIFTRWPSWREEPTTVHDHVSRITLAPLPASDQDLADLASDLMSRPLDPARAPWRLWLVDGTEGCTLVFRVHHALADGLSLLRLLFEVSDEGTSMDAPSPSPPVSRAKDARGRPILSSLKALSRLVGRHADPRSPLRSGPPCGRKRIAWTESMDVASLGAAAHAVDAHINDVFLGALAGALSELGPAAGDAVVHALVPVALAHDDRELGNRFVSLFVPMPRGALSPADRVRAARDAMKEARAHAGVSLGRVLVAGASILGHRAERLAVGRLSRKASLVASNLSGPPVPLHVGGRRITDILFAAPAPGSIALSANAFSYEGKLRITIATDTAVLPDPRRVAELVQEHARRIIASIMGPRT